jgi:hypothetical protein
MVMVFYTPGDICKIHLTGGDDSVPLKVHHEYYPVRNGVEPGMTDNLKVKASKAIDDARVAAHEVYDDASVAAQNALKGAGKGAEKVSDDIKIGVHNAVADAKIAAHETGAKLKKG